jgi:Na+/melibiose symporter-like transporter
MALFDNLLVAFILITLFIMIYCKITNKTLTDVIKEIRDGFGGADE